MRILKTFTIIFWNIVVCVGDLNYMKGYMKIRCEFWINYKLRQRQTFPENINFGTLNFVENVIKCIGIIRKVALLKTLRNSPLIRIDQDEKLP